SATASAKRPCWSFTLPMAMWASAPSATGTSRIGSRRSPPGPAPAIRCLLDLERGADLVRGERGGGHGAIAEELRAERVGVGPEVGAAAADGRRGAVEPEGLPGEAPAAILGVEEVAGGEEVGIAGQLAAVEDGAGRHAAGLEMFHRLAMGAGARPRLDEGVERVVVAAARAGGGEARVSGPLGVAESAGQRRPLPVRARRDHDPRGPPAARGAAGRGVLRR